MIVKSYLKHLIGRAILKVGKYLSLMIIEHGHTKYFSNPMYGIASISIIFYTLLIHCFS